MSGTTTVPPLITNAIATWGPLFVTAVILLTFDGAMLISWARGDATTLQMLNTGINNMAMIAVGYWLGSSAGSARKTEMQAVAPGTVTTTLTPPVAQTTTTTIAPGATGATGAAG